MNIQHIPCIFDAVKLHEKYMMRCIQLAKNGLGTSYPNPLVGSVIVENDRIIGEGWHYKAGMPHAEVNAIHSLKNKKSLQDATIYVNLEPCSHYGKTPPCSDLIIESGIKKVVVGSMDPNPKVAGRGIKKLQDAGIEVEVGVLKDECDFLNRRFFTFHAKKRPFIILKWAESADGFIAPANSERLEKAPVWITNKYSRQRVHQFRAQEQAILIGTSTAAQDNPSLTTRDWYGKNPVRIVLDKTLRLPSKLQVFDKQVKTLVFTENKMKNQPNLEYVQVNFSKDLLENLCEELFKRELQSVIIEGGTHTIQSFIDKQLWDEAYIFKGCNNFRSGIKAPKLSGKIISSEFIKSDNLQIKIHSHR